jgi:hypothetical protein
MLANRLTTTDLASVPSELREKGVPRWGPLCRERFQLQFLRLIEVPGDNPNRRKTAKPDKWTNASLPEMEARRLTSHFGTS